jgi:hypothetical protein
VQRPAPPPGPAGGRPAPQQQPAPEPEVDLSVRQCECDNHGGDWCERPAVLLLYWPLQAPGDQQWTVYSVCAECAQAIKADELTSLVTYQFAPLYPPTHDTEAPEVIPPGKTEDDAQPAQPAQPAGAVTP